MVLQQSLFSGDSERWAQAVAALRAFDFAAAQARSEQLPVEPAWHERRAALQAAMQWLGARMPTAAAATAAQLAAALLEVAVDGMAGRLTRAAAERIDDALARRVLVTIAAGQPFVAGPGSVPRALAQLVVGDATGAQAALFAAIDAGGRGRGDLWGWLGDACTARRAVDDAGPCYVRALLFGADQVDLWRLREPRLAACATQAVAQHGERAARQQLLAIAWRDGVLAVPAGNGWLTPSEQQRLAASCTATVASDAAARLRDFAVLLCLDRALPVTAPIDLPRREAMAALAPDLFAVFAQQNQAAARTPRRR